jgi:hypothetical protein
MVVSNVDIFNDVPYSYDNKSLRNWFVCSFPLASLDGIEVFFLSGLEANRR